MDRDILEEALSLLGDILEAENAEPLHLVASGGAAMVVTGRVSRSTHDIDILATRGEIDGEISPAFPLPDFLMNASRRVAKAKGLETAWLNAATSMLMVPLQDLPQKLWSDLVPREYGSRLKISFLGRSGQIYLKVYAASNREEARDLVDLNALDPESGEIVDAICWMMEMELFPRRITDRLERFLSKIGYEEAISEFN